MCPCKSYEGRPASAFCEEDDAYTKEEAGQYLKSAVIWARESKQTLKEMKADGKGDTPEYAAIAASVATYQVLQGIALLVEERNERAEERARDVDARLSSLVDGLAGIRGDLKHLEVEVDEPRLAEADFEPVLQKLDEITRAIEENKFDWDSREASELNTYSWKVR